MSSLPAAPGGQSTALVCRNPALHSLSSVLQILAELAGRFLLSVLFLVTGFVPVFEAWLGRVEQSVWKPVTWRVGGGGRKWYTVSPLSGS